VLFKPILLFEKLILIEVSQRIKGEIHNNTRKLARSRTRKYNAFIAAIALRY
jgi:hypothetical protein